MRSRRWTLFVIIFGLLFILSLVRGWRLFKTNDKIKDFILAELKPVLGEAFSVAQVEVSLGNIHFRNFSLPLPNQQFVIQISDLRIGYNPFRIITKGFDPRALSQDLLLINPRLLIFLDSTAVNNGRTDTTGTGFRWSYLENFGQAIKGIKFLNRLSIKDGEIVFVPMRSVHKQIARDVQGSIISNSSGEVLIRLAGKMFASRRENLVINGEANLENGGVEYISASLRDFNLKDHIPLFTTPFVTFSEGKLNASLTLIKSDTSANGYGLDGDIDIADAAAQSENGLFVAKAINLTTEIKDWNLHIKHWTQQTNGSATEISGNITNLLHPTFGIDAQCNELSIETFAPLLGKDAGDRLSGLATAKVEITGTMPEVHVQSMVSSPSITYNALSFTKAFLSAEYCKQLLTINEASANVLYNRIAMTGKVDFGSPNRKVEGSISMNGDITPMLRSLSADSNVACSTAFSGRIFGQLANPRMSGEWSFGLCSGPDDSMRVAAHFELRDQMAILDNDYAEGSPQIAGTIDFAHATPKIAFRLEDAQRLIFALWKLPDEETLANKLTLSVEADGTTEAFALEAKLNKRPDQPDATDLAKVRVEIKKGSRDFKGRGKIWLFPSSPDELSGSFSFENDKSGFSLSDFSLNDEVSAYLDVRNLQNKKALSGKMSISGLALARFFNSSELDCAGFLDGELILKGSDLQPELTAYLSMRDVFCNRSGPYSSEMQLLYQNRKLSVEKFVLNSAEATLLYANGIYSPALDSLQLTVKGAGFDINTVAAAFSDKGSTLTGRSLIDLDITGSMTNPQINGLIAVKQGSFFSIPFDELELRIGERNATPLKDKKTFPSINLSQLRLTRVNEFEIIGSGYVPLNLSDSLRLQLEGRGNFLSILRDFTDYFGSNSSNGHFTAHLAGTLSNPAIEKARLSFRDGRMEFFSIIPVVTELSGDIEFLPSKNFVHIVNLEGNMGGEWCRISNYLSSPNLAARPMENLVLGGTRFNFGVTTLETGERGVPLNVLGLMEKGIYGYAQFLGRAQGEGFYIAGPANRPLVRGRINLYRTEIMFPFDETVGPPNPIIYDLLWRTEWDVFAYAVKDVRFVKTYPGALDRVYVNLLIDEQYGGLDFSGQLYDNSFRIEGEARSTTGQVEYLDMEFRVEEAGAQFDRNTIIPIVYGRGRTTISDSTGVPSQVFITLQTVDEAMDNQPVDDLVRQEQARGRFDQIRFKMTTDNPNLGTTEAQLLASLGYSTETLQSKAVDAIGIGTENMLFRPLYRPVERKLEQLFGLDYVRFSSRFARNLLLSNTDHNYELSNRLALLRSSKLVVGKYLADRFFLQYTGQVESGIAYRFKQKGVGLHHILGLEYRINPQILLELEYDYDSMMLYNRDDKKVVLRHWFPF
jgi:hypothetical protein